MDEMDEGALLAYCGVSVALGGAVVLDGVDLALPDGAVTVVTGPSGAGKSTLLRLANRLEVPTAGEVRFRGADVATLDPLWLRRRVGLVAQRPTLFGGTVADNLRVAAPGADDARLADWLTAAGLEAERLEQPAAQLSGGEAQRACLARSLATEPEVLLLDEPTASLDAGPRRAFEAHALALVAAGVPQIWVTHDLGQLRRLADHAVVLVAGRVGYAGDDIERAAAVPELGERP